MRPDTLIELKDGGVSVVVNTSHVTMLQPGPSDTTDIYLSGTSPSDKINVDSTVFQTTRMLNGSKSEDS